MRRLIVAILVVALGWMVWWAIGSTAHEKGLAAWIDARRAEGWAADVGTLDTAGFPNRFDTTLTDLRLADPATGVAWEAPFLQLLSLAYRPTEVIVAFPPEHRLSTPLQTLTFRQEQARGSVFLDPKPSLPLNRATIVIDALTLSSSADWQVSLDQARFATERVPAREHAHRVGAEFVELNLPDAMRSTLDPAGLLPETIAKLHLDADLGFTAPWDRAAIETARPQITDIDLRDLSANWGDITFRAAGELKVDRAGWPTGQITLRAVEWRQLLDMALAAGLVPAESEDTLERALGFLAALSGPPNTIDAPLSFANGVILIGPVPIARAPRIVIR